MGGHDITFFFFFFFLLTISLTGKVLPIVHVILGPAYENNNGNDI